MTNNALPSGFEINQYTVHNVISKNHYTITYSATDQTSQRFVIKEYYPAAISQRSIVGSVEPLSEKEQKDYRISFSYFYEIGLNLVKIKHRNIVNVKEVISQHGTAYLVMYYEEGVTLADIFKQTKKLDEEDIINIVFPILKGLKELHNAGIFHLAIQPENILIKSDGTPVLIGLGSSLHQFLTGETFIKPHNTGYAPIEQYSEQDEKIGGWTDIYALAALLYQCISREQPPESIERIKSLDRTGVDILGSAQEIGKGVYQDHILAAIDHALQLYPHDRPKTVNEWTQQFLQLTDNNDQFEEQKKGLKSAKNDHTAENQNGIKQLEAIIENQEQRRKRWEAYLGGKEQIYYMSKFLSQEKHSIFPKVSWNWAAFVFSMLWLMYRKMYLFALVALPVLSVAIIYLAHYFIENNLLYEKHLFINPAVDLTIVTYLVFIALFIGLFGNYFYFLHVSFKSHLSEKKYADLSSQRKWLSQKGGTAYTAPLFAIVTLSFGINYAYQYLSNKEKIVQQQINSGLTALKNTANNVKAFRIRNNRWPKSADELSTYALEDQYKYVENIYIKNKLIVVTFQNNGVIPDIAGKSIALFATELTDGNMSWLCGSINLSLQHLPLECKRKLK